MILVIVNTDLSETNFDVGIAVVPFSSWVNAYDYANEVAKKIDPESYAESVVDCVDIHGLLDSWNDLGSGRHSIKLQSGFNTAGHVLGQDHPSLASIKTVSVEIPLADKQ